MLTDATYFIADKAYDSETIRTKLKQDNISPVIPKRKNTKQPNLAFDHYLYKLRHLVENTFARLKHFRSIATRYEKLARNYKSMLYLACTMIHCKLNQGHALDVEYELNVKDYLDKIYIAPAATQYQPYLAKLLCDTGVKIDLSNNPYRQT